MHFALVAFVIRPSNVRSGFNHFGHDAVVLVEARVCFVSVFGSFNLVSVRNELRARVVHLSVVFHVFEVESLDLDLVESGLLDVRLL